jgi:hypothetical protein
MITAASAQAMRDKIAVFSMGDTATIIGKVVAIGPGAKHPEYITINNPRRVIIQFLPSEGDMGTVGVFVMPWVTKRMNLMLSAVQYYTEPEHVPENLLKTYEAVLDVESKMVFGDLNQMDTQGSA